MRTPRPSRELRPCRPRPPCPAPRESRQRPHGDAACGDAPGPGTGAASAQHRGPERRGALPLAAPPAWMWMPAPGALFRRETSGQSAQADPCSEAAKGPPGHPGSQVSEWHRASSLLCTRNFVFSFLDFVWFLISGTGRLGGLCGVLCPFPPSLPPPRQEADGAPAWSQRPEQGSAPAPWRSFRGVASPLFPLLLQHCPSRGRCPQLPLH